MKLATFQTAVELQEKMTEIDFALSCLRTDRKTFALPQETFDACQELKRAALDALRAALQAEFDEL